MPPPCRSSSQLAPMYFLRDLSAFLSRAYIECILQVILHFLVEMTRGLDVNRGREGRGGPHSFWVGQPGV